jgi:hypothetical protein
MLAVHNAIRLHRDGTAASRAESAVDRLLRLGSRA